MTNGGPHKKKAEDTKPRIEAPARGKRVAAGADKPAKAADASKR